jgi:hypothetical protein
MNFSSVLDRSDGLCACKSIWVLILGLVQTFYAERSMFRSKFEADGTWNVPDALLS